jgi:hypothetical protein
LEGRLITVRGVSTAAASVPYPTTIIACLEAKLQVREHSLDHLEFSTKIMATMTWLGQW